MSHFTSIKRPSSVTLVVENLEWCVRVSSFGILTSKHVREMRWSEFVMWLTCPSWWWEPYA